jgi:hypothetical protein
LHRQGLLSPVQRLDLRLLIDAEHDRVLGRVQIQPDYIGDLGDTLGNLCSAVGVVGDK